VDDSYEATRRIKVDPVLKAITIVAAGSFVMKGDEEKGACGWLRSIRDQAL
jgi:hypothetical protein